MSPQPKGQDFQVRLKAPLKVSGTIVDAETNRPPARCTVIQGIEYDDGRAPEWQRVTGTKAITDGRYEFVFADGVFCRRVRVEAEGYMPAISRVFRPGGSDRVLATYDFQLHKAAPLSGSVLGQDGKPLANATVYLATNLLIVDDRKASYQTLMNARMVRTNAAGRFELPPEVEPFYLVVLDDQGYAVINEKQFAESAGIHIKPWTPENRSFRAERRPSTGTREPPAAKTEHALTVRIIDEAGKPVEGAHVATNVDFHVSPNQFVPYESGWSYSPNILSDNDGMAHIADPYNRCVVARHVERKLVGVRSIAQEQMKGTESVTLTMHPQCAVSGKLTAKRGEERNRKLTWSNVYVYLDDGMGRPMSCMSEKADYHFYLPPGTFTLEAYGTDTQHVRKTVTVKPGQEKLEVEPIDLPPTGLVLLEGKLAPELRDIAAWKNGGPLKLADLRGKVVILVFMPDESMWDETLTNLLAAYEKHHQQGLEVIEIRINHRDTLDSQAKIEAHLTRIKNPEWSGREIPIPMALVVRNLLSAKPNAKSVQVPFFMSDYGITSVPTAVLIDRQGRVSGPLQFRGKFDEALLKKVLGQK